MEEPTTRTGGCLCGAVRYACGPLGAANYCHCADCRRVTGSAFNVGVKVGLASFTAAGPIRAFSKRGDSGGLITRHFCGECGSPIYTSSPAHPDYVFLKAGSLDDPSIPAPTHESWTDSQVAWAHPASGIARYSKGRI